MTEQLTDRTGAPVEITLATGNPINSYVLGVADATRIGRVDFIESPDSPDERIIFHTEVDPECGGRGLAGVLVAEALAASIRENKTVVPVCPLFARHLKSHGEEFVARVGSFRQPTQDDIATVTRAVRTSAT